MKFPYLTLDKKKIYALGCFNHEWNNDRIKKKCRIMTKKSNKLGKLVLVAPDNAPPLCHL